MMRSPSSASWRWQTNNDHRTPARCASETLAGEEEDDPEGLWCITAIK